MRLSQDLWQRQTIALFLLIALAAGCSERRTQQQPAYQGSWVWVEQTLSNETNRIPANEELVIPFRAATYDDIRNVRISAVFTLPQDTVRIATDIIRQETDIRYLVLDDSQYTGYSTGAKIQGIQDVRVISERPYTVSLPDVTGALRIVVRNNSSMEKAVGMKIVVTFECYNTTPTKFGTD